MFVGLTANGAFAEYVVIEGFMAHKMLDNVTFEPGAMVESAAVAAYGLQQSGIKMEDTVLITDAGPIGLHTALVDLASGASQMFITDLSVKRLKKAL